MVVLWTEPDLCGWSDYSKVAADWTRKQARAALERVLFHVDSLFHQDRTQGLHPEGWKYTQSLYQYVWKMDYYFTIFMKFKVPDDFDTTCPIEIVGLFRYLLVSQAILQSTKLPSVALESIMEATASSSLWSEAIRLLQKCLFYGREVTLCLKKRYYIVYGILQTAVSYKQKWFPPIYFISQKYNILYQTRLSYHKAMFYTCASIHAYLI